MKGMRVKIFSCKEFVVDENMALKKGFDEAVKKGKLFNVMSWKKKRENERVKFNKECK